MRRWRQGGSFLAVTPTTSYTLGFPLDCTRWKRSANSRTSSISTQARWRKRAAVVRLQRSAPVRIAGRKSTARSRLGSRFIPNSRERESDLNPCWPLAACLKDLLKLGMVRSLAHTRSITWWRPLQKRLCRQTRTSALASNQASPRIHQKCAHPESVAGSTAVEGDRRSVAVGRRI